MNALSSAPCRPCGQPGYQEGQLEPRIKVVCVTPFPEDRRLDEGSLHTIVAHLAGYGSASTWAVSALAAVGSPAGAMRRPYLPLSPADIEQLLRDLKLSG